MRSPPTRPSTHTGHIHAQGGCAREVGAAPDDRSISRARDRRRRRSGSDLIKVSICTLSPARPPTVVHLPVGGACANAGHSMCPDTESRADAVEKWVLCCGGCYLSDCLVQGPHWWGVSRWCTPPPPETAGKRPAGAPAHVTATTSRCSAMRLPGLARIWGWRRYRYV